MLACPLCSQCLFLESAGSQNTGGGKLIYLPEMEQQELNAFCHVLFCAMINGTGYRDTAQTVYRTLKFRAQAVEDKFGAGSSDPAVFGQLLLEYLERSKDENKNDNKDKNKKGKDVMKRVLVDVRLLPNYAKFKKQLEAWASSAAKELDTAKE